MVLRRCLCLVCDGIKTGSPRSPLFLPCSASRPSVCSVSVLPGASWLLWISGFLIILSILQLINHHHHHPYQYEVLLVSSSVGPGLSTHPPQSIASTFMVNTVSNPVRHASTRCHALTSPPPPPPSLQHIIYHETKPHCPHVYL